MAVINSVNIPTAVNTVNTIYSCRSPEISPASCCCFHKLKIVWVRRRKEKVEHGKGHCHCCHFRCWEFKSRSKSGAVEKIIRERYGLRNGSLSQGQLSFTKEETLLGGNYVFDGYTRKGECYHVLFLSLNDFSVDVCLSWSPLFAISWSTIINSRKCRINV